MLVYGDHSESVDPRERLRTLSEDIGAVVVMLAGIERHSKLVGALIDAGQLQQGVEDAGCRSAELAAIVHRLAAATIRSWDSGYAAVGELSAPPALDLPQRVELRLPEGFAFYAVYPEAYITAARRLRLSGPARVIGIRSVGTTLGAMVAAALGAPPAITVRPFGDPFTRQIELPPDAIVDGAHYVIVDEGPGLSGSSFGATADALEQRRVPLERIAFLPSHGGDPGPHASEAHRRRWSKAQRVAAKFDPSFLVKLFGPLDEFSNGDPFERRKYLATKNGGRFLLKFAGLGSIGERKLQMARTLSAAGLAPEPLGLAHGFLVERWRSDARPLAPNDKPVEEIGRYIGTRARMFPADQDSGATIEQLAEMCRRNISLALGESAAALFDAQEFRALHRYGRVRTDNKLDRHEWLRTADGRLLKTDALDHHQAHDLIGCQPVEWDVAGAITEFALDAGESARLTDATGCRVDHALLDLYRWAYAAFRLGQSQVAAELTGAAAARQSANRYRRTIQLLLEGTCARETAGILG